MKRAQQARNAARAYAQGNALSSINAARRVGAGLDVLRATDADKALLTPHYAKMPLSTLRDYQENNETAGALIDQGREPFLVGCLGHHSRGHRREPEGDLPAWKPLELCSPA